MHYMDYRNAASGYVQRLVVLNNLANVVVNSGMCTR